jgi:hypothetical protein
MVCNSLIRKVDSRLPACSLRRSRSKPPRHLKQRPPRCCRVARQRQHPRDLPRPSRQRSQHGAKANRPTSVQRDQRRRRQIPFRRVADCPYHGKRHPIRPRDPSDRTTFQVDRTCPCCGKQRCLCRRLRHYRGPRQDRLARDAAKSRTQSRICGQPFALRQYVCCDDHRPRSQRRIEPASQPEADQPTGALLRQLCCDGPSPRRRPTPGRDQSAKPGGNPRFGRQPNDKPECQNPNSTRRVLPRIKPR